MAPEETVPTWTRWFVRAFLTAFVVCGVAGVELWPLTGWRLFSHLRHDVAVSWQAFAVGPDGSEARVAFRDLPGGYRAFGLLASKFEALPPDRRDATCRAWVEGLRSLDARTRSMRVYMVEQPLTPRAGRRPGLGPTRELAFECPGRA